MRHPLLLATLAYAASLSAAAAQLPTTHTPTTGPARPEVLVPLSGTWTADYEDARQILTVQGAGDRKAPDAAAAATLFGAAYPVVVPSTVDSAFDVTIADASVSDYTLTVMTWAAGIGLPVVLGYQAWTYWVFRKRLTAEPVHEEQEQPAEAHA